MGEGWGPVVAMLVVDVALAVMNVLAKKALDQGMNCLVLITVRQVIAAAFIAPIAYFKERKSRPKLTWWISAQFFFSALLGACLTQYFFFVGLRYTTATFACAFVNMAPVFTFLIALSLRQERLSLKSAAGRAKFAATGLCIGGVLVLMLYKGPPLGRVITQLPHAAAVVDRHKEAIRWTIGSMALLAGCLCWSAWFIVQANIGRQYPAVYSGTTIMFFFASLQAAIITVATQRGGMAVWAASLNGRLQIATVLYAGVVGSGLSFLVMSWCIGKRGPVFTVAFSPPIQVFVAIIDFALTRQPPLLGSVLGSILIILGLYILLWGKSKEVQRSEVKHVQAMELDNPKPVSDSCCAVEVV